jgi:hypothetical protein
VLTGAGFGDNPVLAGPTCQNCLPENVVQLVSTGVQQILTLQVDTPIRGEPLGEGERRWPAGVFATQLLDFDREIGILACSLPTGLKLIKSRNERLRYVPAAV